MHAWFILSFSKLEIEFTHSGRFSHTVTDRQKKVYRQYSDKGPLPSWVPICVCVWWWCQICKYELILLSFMLMIVIVWDTRFFWIEGTIRYQVIIRRLIFSDWIEINFTRKSKSRFIIDVTENINTFVDRCQTFQLYLSLPTDEKSNVSIALYSWSIVFI